ncbi:MAG TPA: xanthine dehydrogenase family protein subunit M [Jatrophihabitans sp.]|nr:xanthine dehydrogenase family protein subunit M [Jatrophihabitans sp.]
MRRFDYHRAADVDAAVLLLADRPGAKLLAGGTNLTDLMKLGVEQPDALIDVSRLGLDEISELPDGGLRIGAGVRNSDLAAHPAVRRGYPVLSRALLSGASGQLRNLATTAGNLLQRTRCRYFQDVSKPCNKRRPGSGCPAIEGDHHNLAILGASEHCVATHPSDLAVALVALDAELTVRGGDAERTLPLTGFYLPPDDRPDREYGLGHAEVITAVTVPALSFGAVSGYRKARERASYAFAIGSVAAALDVTDGVVADVRIALGAVAHKPWRASIAERALVGEPAVVESYERAIDAELAAARPLRDNGYKVGLIRRLVVATLAELAGDPELRS